MNPWTRNVLLSAGRTREETALGWDLNPISAIKSVGKAVSGAVSGAASGTVKLAGSGIKTAGKLSGSLGKTIGSLPVVGAPLAITYDLSIGAPIKFASAVASGERIDKAAYNHLKEQVKNVQDVAPYAQTVVSLVPGIGTGVAAGIAAAHALSKGKPIDEAVIAGVRGAIPGGPMAQAAFDVGVAAMQGKPVDETLLQAIPLPPDQKKYVVQGVLAAKDIAKGKAVDSSLYERGSNVLPPDARKALQVGVAMAQAKNLQSATAIGARAAIPKLADIGVKAVNLDATLKAGELHLTPEVRKGYHVGAGFLKFKANPVALKNIRGHMAPEQKKGFDIALSAHVGRLASPVSTKVPPQQRFGFYVARGSRGAKPKNREAMLKAISTHPKMRAGVKVATKKEVTIWTKFLRLIGWK